MGGKFKKLAKISKYQKYRIRFVITVNNPFLGKKKTLQAKNLQGLLVAEIGLEPTASGL